MAESGVHEANAHWGPHVCDCLERKVNCLRGGDGTTEEAEVTAGQMIVWDLGTRTGTVGEVGDNR